MDKKRLYALIAVLVVICGGAAWYFMYYTKTPTYSLYLIRDAVQKHDVQSFKQHVDLDRVMPRLVDDYFGYALKNDPEMKNNPFKGLAEGIVNVAKPAMVSALKDKVIRIVEGDMSDNNQQSLPTTGSNTANAAPVENLNVSAIDYKGITYEKKDGKLAIIGIKAVDPKLFDEFTFDIKMSELNDGKWQIVEVANAKEYFTKLDHDTKIAIKRYINEIQPILDVSSKKSEEFKNKYGVIKFVDLTMQHVEEIDARHKECYDAIEKVEVPAAAQELANLRKQRRKLFEEEVTIYKRIVNEGMSKAIDEELKNHTNKLEENWKKIEKITNSVKDIQVP